MIGVSGPLGEWVGFGRAGSLTTWGESLDLQIEKCKVLQDAFLDGDCDYDHNDENADDGLGDVEGGGGQ